MFSLKQLFCFHKWEYVDRVPLGQEECQCVFKCSKCDKLIYKYFSPKGGVYRG